ncbi:hypothetical protein MNBD_ALPHA11-1225 [hydrothermal vent metagenome]|uniref:Lipoprotein n=1 Tax=hydrothermal vent metagenome TaxID=652676 RepID=A0A3B0U2H8_9ZZZZ
MLSSSKVSIFAIAVRFSKISIWIIFSLILSACTFSPVYSNPDQNDTAFNLEFASANTRLEQIVYSELAASFSNSSAIKENLVEVIVSSSNVTPGVRSVGLTGKITVTNIQSSKIVYVGSRTASATYGASGQSLANQQAANEASERAARELAQTIRLTLIGVLSAQSQR